MFFFKKSKERKSNLLLYIRKINRLNKKITVVEKINESYFFILNSSPQGILYVDRDKRIVFINDTACKILNINKDIDYLNRNIIEIARNQKIYKIICDTLQRNLRYESEIVIDSLQILEIKSLATSEGCIVYLQDITSIKKLEQVRRDFVSNVTHELKTPLTSIKGFVETLRSGAINDFNVSNKFLEIIEIEAERLSNLINDILDLSDIEARKYETNITITPLKVIVDEVVTILDSKIKEKGIIFNQDIENGATIEANKDRIKQLLINLLDNSIKYSHPNGNVSIFVIMNNSRIVITIQDDGIGISKENIDRIFERFYRVDKGRSRNQGGTGLGLSIVKHIINLYNGDLKVLSTPNKGTKFIVTLPNRM